ncbi:MULTISPECIES: hypothetical protein [Marinobacter]|jgi:hypothetical protein|uniref:hypothetical protein n=1 Tax=Marinobacter TaxID=2742 RepID=UPI0018F2110E|nr:MULTISPECIES: hypothetical protein [Marinobacter]MBJ7277292.1 hypothetical protein [Marinobacter salarius]MDM8180043.1 hypothetical protein [Marinobacter salarius]
MTSISFSGSIINIDGKSVQLSHDIVEAYELYGVIVVLLDPDSDMGTVAQFRNLIGLKMNGHMLWEAELPTNKKSDVYWKISQKNPLKACSFSSFECEIDSNNGKIIKKIFINDLVNINN